MNTKISRRSIGLAIVSMASALFFAAASSAVHAATAAPFPTKPITIVVPYPAGGAADILARLVGEKLAQKWGVAVVVDNKPGASGQIGTEYVGKAQGDPYKLVLATQAAFAVLPTLNNRPDFNVNDGFTPVAQLTIMPSVILAPASLGISSLEDLVALLRAGKPGQYNFSSNGEGTAQHLIPVELLEAIGVTATHVPYKGSPQALSALAAGDQVTFGVDNIPSAIPYIQSGRVKVLAVTTSSRSAELPNVPTVEESGIKNFNKSTWLGLMAPPGIARDVQQKISQDVREVLADPALIRQIEKTGFIPQWKGAEDFRKHVNAEQAHYKELLTRLGLAAH